LDKDFKFEVSREPGGENIMYCFACGTCAGICPVGDKNEQFDPRRIIRLAILGFRDEVLSSPAIWLCSTCYSCSVRCPQDVKITALMGAIQTISSREGYAHDSYRMFIEMAMKHKHILELSEFENSQRAKLGCPELTVNPEETIKLLEHTESLDIIKRKAKEKEKTNSKDEAETTEEGDSE
jgi:heterodisulfide reductase subunit C